MKKIILIIIGVFLIGGIASYAFNKSQGENKSMTENSKQQTHSSTQMDDEREKARATALNQVSGTVKFEYEDDEYIFLIEKDNTISEVEIDRTSGFVDDVETVTYKNEITYDKAQSIALTKVNGTIKEAGIDDDEYDFTIEKDRVLYEIEIDSHNGNIRKVEQENTFS